MDALHSNVDQFFRPLTNWVTTTFGLTVFPIHASTFYITFLSFCAIHISSAYISRALFPNIYPKLPRRTRYFWTVHCVSMSHALVVVPWSWYLVWNPDIQISKTYGWDERLGGCITVALAYFVWDTFETALGGSGLDFVAHGFACSFIYGLGLRPWCAYYGPRALIWETSTIFLNIHWFLDKAGKTGSSFQLVNGILLLGTFFAVRLVYGAFVSYDFVSTLWSVRNEVHPILTAPYAIGNIMLNCLNWFWFGKMIDAIRKRFDGSEDKKNASVAIKVDNDTIQVPNADAVKAALPNGKVSKRH